MPTYYEAAKKADRLVALELCYDGTVRPMERVNNGGIWKDVAGVYESIQITKNAPLEFSVEMVAKTAGMCCIEFTGWVPPYKPNRAYYLGQSWPFDQGELDYAPVANSNNTAVGKMAFQFKSDGTLTWSAGDGPAEECSLRLDAKKLKFAYVVLRVTDKNEGLLKTPGLKFKLKNGSGAGKSKFSC